MWKVGLQTKNDRKVQSMLEITVNSDEYNLKKWEQILPATYYDELVEMTKREWGEEYADYEYDAYEVLD